MLARDFRKVVTSVSAQVKTYKGIGAYTAAIERVRQLVNDVCRENPYFQKLYGVDSVERRQLRGADILFRLAETMQLETRSEANLRVLAR